MQRRKLRTYKDFFSCSTAGQRPEVVRKLRTYPQIAIDLQSLVVMFLNLRESFDITIVNELHKRPFHEFHPQMVEEVVKLLQRPELHDHPDLKELCLDTILAFFPINKILCETFNIAHATTETQKTAFLRAVLLRSGTPGNTEPSLVLTPEIDSNRRLVADTIGEVFVPKIPEMPMIYCRENVPTMAFSADGKNWPVQQKIEQFPRTSIMGCSRPIPPAEMETTIGESFAAVRASTDGMALCQDVGGVVLDEKTQKVRRFAVSDGVGSCFGSLAVARKAVYDALLKIYPDKSYEKASDFLAKYMQDVARSVTGAYHQESFLQSLQSIGAEVPPRLLSYYKDTVLNNPNMVGSATLIAGLIENGYFYDAHLGDGGRMIFDKHGVVRSLVSVATHKDVAPPQINLAQNTPIPLECVDCYATPVVEGDRVFVFTDGVLKYLDKNTIVLIIRDLISRGASNETICRELTMRNTHDEKNPGWLDDVTILGFTI